MSAVGLLLQAAVLTVGGSGFPSVTAAIASAQPGDTIVVLPGVYAERPIVDKPLVILGQAGAVIDGNGEGAILRVHHRSVIRGLTLRRTGANQSREDAGIIVEAASGSTLESNILEDVLFGIYVKQSDSVIIRDNRIIGKDLPHALRGDGIKLWYSHYGAIDDNTVERSRDVVIWFSNGTSVRRNRIHASRYGLHYMYSHHNDFEANEFVDNSVGAFIMYSTDITFRGNLFAQARGTAGRGLGFKDAERITAIGNTLVKNAIGVSFDNSPYSMGQTNTFRDNVIAYNDVGIYMLPSVERNEFSANTFLDNVVPIRISGGGTATRNRWRENYWSEYAGFDTNRDGVGDLPFVFERLSDDLLAKHEALQLFQMSPAVTALNALSRVLPLLQPEPLVVDSIPALADRLAVARSHGAPLWASLFTAPAVVAALFVARHRRRAIP